MLLTIANIYLYVRFETGRFVNLTFFKPYVLKPDVLNPDVFETWRFETRRFVGVP